MSRKNLPYIFLLLLILLLMFIGGVKYGQRVEEANKTIKYILSITPTKIPVIPTTIPIGFKSETSEECGISFLIPDNLSVEEDLSGMAPMAWINESKEVEITYECYKYGDIPEGGLITMIPTYTPKVAFEKFYDIPNIATESMTIDTKKITLYKSEKEKGRIALKFIHPISEKYIGISISKKLYPLFERTLEFITPTPTKKQPIPSIITP